MNSIRLLQFAKEFGDYCTRRYAPLAQAHGLSMREIHVLLFLANNPGYDTARDIVEYRGISKSQVSQAVDFLVEMDYLARTPDREDRRLLHLSITPAGLPVARQAQAIQEQCTLAMLSGLTAEQQAQFLSLWDIVLSTSHHFIREADNEP